MPIFDRKNLTSISLKSLLYVAECIIMNTYKYGANMGTPKTVRFEDKIESKVQIFLKRNPDIKLAKLINLAVDKFISEPQKIELVPVDPDEWELIAKKEYKRHKKAMDELK